MTTEPMTLIEKLRNPAWESADGPAGELPAVLNVEQTVATMTEAAERLESHRNRPVAFRVKDYTDGWIIFQNETDAYTYAASTGALLQALYVRDGT